MRRSNETKTVLGDFLSFVQVAERAVQGDAPVRSGTCLRGLPKPCAGNPQFAIPTTSGCIVSLLTRQAQRRGIAPGSHRHADTHLAIRLTILSLPARVLALLVRLYGSS